MKKSKQSYFVPIVIIIVGFLIFLMICWVAFIDVISNKPQIRQYCAETHVFIDKNSEVFPEIFSKIFTTASTCHGNLQCKQEVSMDLMGRLHGKEDTRYFESTYFLRLASDGMFEKLFLSGDLNRSVPKTRQERNVRALLLGRRDEICDEGWKVDGNELNTGFSGSHMRYLYDMYSEAEIIIPIRSDGKVIGAIVRAWGD